MTDRNLQVYQRKKFEYGVSHYLMQSIKEKVIEIIQNLPNDVKYNDIFEAIYFQQKIEIGLNQSAEKQGIPHEEVRKRFEKWLK